MMDTLVMSAPTHSAVSTSSQNQETMTRKRKKLNAAENIKFLEPKTISSNNKMEDEHSVFGQIVAVTLRKLTRDMLICCKKIMNDAMFEAEMGTLTKYSKIICDPGVRKHERSFTDLPVQILPSTNPTSIQGQTTVRALPQKNKPVIGHSKTSVVNDDVTKKSKTLSSNHTGSNKDINQKELEITSAWSKSDPNSSFRNDETDTLALEVIKEFTFSDFGQRTSIVSSSEMGRSILPDTHKSGSNSAVQLMKVEPEWNKEEAGADEVILDSMDSSSATFEQETESLDSALVGEDQGQKSSQVRTYCIVQFTGRRKPAVEIAIACSKWLDMDVICYWPPYQNQHLLNIATENCEDVGPTWIPHTVTVIKKDIGTYSDAEEQLDAISGRSETESDFTELSTPVKTRTPNSKLKLSPRNEEYESEEDQSNQTEDPPNIPAEEQKTSQGETSRGHDVVMPSQQVYSTPIRRNKQQQQKVEETMLRPFEKRLQSNVIDVQRQLEFLTCLVMERYSGSDDRSELTDAWGEPLPLSSVDELENMEKTLKESPADFKKLFTKLSILGGKDLKQLTGRMMGFLLTDDLGAKCNWSGYNGKTGIKISKLLGAIKEAVHRVSRFQEISDIEIEENVRKWLKNTTDKSKCRKRKSVPQQPQENYDPAVDS